MEKCGRGQSAFLRQTPCPPQNPFRFRRENRQLSRLSQSDRGWQYAHLAPDGENFPSCNGAPCAATGDRCRLAKVDVNVGKDVLATVAISQRTLRPVPTAPDCLNANV